MEEQFLDKVIIAKIKARDNTGKLTNKLIEVCGKCTFIGPNINLGWPLQVTIDRTPFEIEHITHIRLK